MITQSWLDALPFGVLVTDTSLRLLQINSWLAARLLDGEAKIGQPLGKAFPEVVERSLLAAFELMGQEGRSIQLTNNLKDHFLHLPAEPGTDLEAMPQLATIAPLRADGQITGAMIVIEDVTQRLLTERQLERQIDKMTALHEVDQALANLDLQACLQIIVDRTRVLLAAHSSALYLLDGDRLVAASVTGGDPACVGLSIPISQGTIGRAASSRQPVLSPEAAHKGRHLAQRGRSQSEIAAPLLLQGDCLGVINVDSAQINGFDATSVETLEWLAARAAAAINNARLHGAAREQRTLADNLRNIGLSLAAELNPDAILDTLLDHVSKVVPFDTAAVMTIEARSGRVRIARQRGYERFGVLHLVADFDVLLSSIPNLSIMAHEMRPQVVPYIRSYPDWRPTELAAHIESWAGAPIIARGQVLGFLSLNKVQPGYYRIEMAERLAAFAAQAGPALENARLYAEQQKLAVTDSLTGIANRRYFDQELVRELQRASRFKRSTALITIDLDDFKVFNDRYGHPTGDDLLRAIALLLSQSVRTIDTVARYGGEEFVLILPESDAPAAYATAERLRDLVARLPLLPAPAPAPWVQAADDALYAAKRAGKKRVVLFAPPALQPQSYPASAAD